MELEYCEIQEDAYDTYNSRRGVFKYTLENTFYSLLSEYDMRSQHNLTERTSIYIAFANVLIDKNEKFDFIIDATKELLEKVNLDEVKEELGERNYILFKEDLERAKAYMGIV